MAGICSLIPPTLSFTKVGTCSSGGSARRSAFGEGRFCSGWRRCCWQRISSANASLRAFVFCTFFFFENWLYIATYMADARAMVLPLVTTGDSDYVEHDWNTIFTSLGVLRYDTSIAAVVRFMGWCGMLASTVWLVTRITTTQENSAFAVDGARTPVAPPIAPGKFQA